MPTIVIVDDNEHVRQLLLDYLAQAAPDLDVVGVATNGDEAVVVVTREQPDGVILDWQMPVVNGIEALPRIRSVAPDAVVVMYSSSGSDGEVVALDAGAHAYVDKQDGPQTVVSRLRSLLGS